MFCKTAIRRWLKDRYGIVGHLKSLVPAKGDPCSAPVIALSLPKSTVNVEQVRDALKADGLTGLIDVRLNNNVNNREDESFKSHLLMQLEPGHFVDNVLRTFVNDPESFGRDNRPAGSAHLDGAVLIEFSSPNIAKPFHYGHLRSTIIGNFIANLHSYFGHNVVRLNYLGDWGTQFGLLSLGYELYGDQQELIRSACKHLLDVYVRINGECDRRPELRQAAKDRFSALERKSDSDLLMQWTRFREYSIANYKAVYDRMGIGFDAIHGESMYSSAAGLVVERLRSMGLLVEQADGAKFVKLSGSGTSGDTAVTDNAGAGSGGIPLIKSDGSTLYLTRDIAAAIHRMDQYRFAKMYYVVENGQWIHFDHLKNVLGQMNYEWANRIEHVKFGRINGMSTRKGTAVLLEDILDEARQRALGGMKATATTKVVDPQDMERAADILGQSGLLINDFRMGRKSNYAFSWDDALRQKGESGIALQYAHARLCNLENNCGHTLNIGKQLKLEAISSPEAMRLVVSISNFDESLFNTYRELEPRTLMRYLFSLSDSLSKAIRTLPVKNSAEHEANTRLMLFRAARNVLAQGMSILGLRPLKAM